MSDGLAAVGGRGLPGAAHELWAEFLPVVRPHGEWAYAEALLRTGTPGLHTEVIELAERDGSIWMLDVEMLRRVRVLLEATGAELRLGVNVSGVTVQRHGGVWLSHLRPFGPLTSRIVVELTETALHLDAVRTIDFVHECRELGVKVAVDDYDSMQFDDQLVAQLAPDYMKLAHVWDGGLGGKSLMRLANHIDRAQQLGCKEIIVEWVDSEAKVEFAKRSGVGLLQGSFLEPHVSFGCLERRFGSRRRGSLGVTGSFG